MKFNQSTYNVDEDDGPAQPVLVLSNPSSTDITISVFSTDGSATGKNTICDCLWENRSYRPFKSIEKRRF